MTVTEHTITEPDAEFDAMRAVYAALKDLEPAAQDRVLDYVFRRLGVKRDRPSHAEPGTSFSPQQLAQEVRNTPSDIEDDVVEEENLSEVSPVAQKWIRRNGLTADQLSELFSLGHENIELVARSVPGKTTKDRARNVLLLTGAAGYLGSGAARVDDEALRQTLGHYNAYDRKNFATHIRDWGAEVSGSKENGYTLTARGLAAAADLIKEMAESAKA